MDLKEIGNLLAKISIHYPKFAQQISDEQGRMRRDVAEEWQRIIGFLDYTEAVQRLDKYMESDDGHRIPMPADLKLVKTAPRQEYFSGGAKHQWHIEGGELYDEEGRRWASPSYPDDPFYYDDMGRICQRGRVLYG